MWLAQDGGGMLGANEQGMVREACRSNAIEHPRLGQRIRSLVRRRVAGTAPW